MLDALVHVAALVQELLYVLQQYLIKRALICARNSSSSSTSQDRPIGPLPAKCWPEAFQATFIHNIRDREGDDRKDGGEA